MERIVVKLDQLNHEIDELNKTLETANDLKLMELMLEYGTDEVMDLTARLFGGE